MFQHIQRPRLLAVAGLAVASAITLTACSAESPGDQSSTTSEPAAAVPVAAVETEATVQQNRLSVASAQEVAAAALASCQAEGLGFVSVAVVDRNGQLQALLRGDNAAAHTIEAAQQKAYTSAAFGAATSELAPRAEGTGATMADLPGTLFLPGGVPVKLGEATIGGVGVGGAPDGLKDESCAAAGIAVLTGAAQG